MNTEFTALEITKLMAGALTPISVAILGLFLGRAAKRFEARQWANQKVVEKRIAVYDLVAPQLNDLYCYLCRVGNWKELSPADIILTKRKTDRTVYVYRPLFSPLLFETYQAFVGCCFATWSGEGHDARILTDVEKHKAAALLAGKPWDALWSNKFDSSKAVPIARTQAAYDALMMRFSKELGVGLLDRQPD